MLFIHMGKQLQTLVVDDHNYVGVHFGRLLCETPLGALIHSGCYSPLVCTAVFHVNKNKVSLSKMCVGIY